MKKDTFIMRDRQGKEMGGPVGFYPLMFTAGTVTHRLALHKEASGLPDTYKQWQVSCPTVGAKVCMVRSHYKGVPVSSGRLTVTQARAAAMESLEALLERIGSDKFNAVILAARGAA